MLLHELFDRALAQWPEHVAIDVAAADGRARCQTTYRQLAAQAATLAWHLRAFVARECNVAVLLQRDSAHLYAAQLAALQCGAAHVCLDPAFPDAHLEHVLRDCAAVAVFTDQRFAERLRRLALPTRVLDVAQLLASTSTPAPAPLAPPPWLQETSLAYVIYTSGTTGKPKGALIEHRGVTSLVQAGVERFAIAPGDRIAQGSSPAYDSSIEEAWLALAAGATVVPLDDEAVRMGPDLVPWLRAQRITVLCPPPTLLRAMDCRDPTTELPDLRLCYAGGEAMPQDLADLWGKAVWLENGYGPTECTVTVVRGRLRPGEPVAIGTPVPGHTAWLLDDTLQPTAPGAAGELCLGGIGLARGYLGLPELTAQRFPTVPGLGRIYRTGDLARRGDDGQLYYLGRIDAQVKLRGYRIELEAIEAALAAAAGVREAACRVQNEAGADLLCAFVVPDEPNQPPTAQALEASLRSVLPGYMIPARYAIAPSLPKTVGGKLDRKALPALPSPATSTEPRAHGKRTAPNERQRTIEAAFAACLGSSEFGLDDDFFALGGDSLRAARVISALRREPRTAMLAVRDVYTARTVAALAALADERTRPTTAAGPQPSRAPSADHALLVTAAQTAWLLLLLLAGSAAAWLLAFVLLPQLLADSGLIACLLLSPLLGAGLLAAHTVASLWFAVLAKQLLVGRYTAGRVPVWGSFHLRHWLVKHAVRLVPWGLLEGTVFQSTALRLLGARIGARVHIHRDVDLLLGGWDLLEIGDDATLGREAHLGLVELDAGHLVVGPVRIGARSTLETRAGMGPDTSLGDGALLTALSFVSPQQRVPDGERWHGVPARAAGRTEPVPAIDVPGRVLSPRVHGLCLVLSRLLLGPAFAVPFVVLCLALATLAGFDTAACVAWLYRDGPSSQPWWIAAACGLAIAALVSGLLVQALLLRWTTKVPTGTCSRWSLHYLRLWLRTGTLEAAGVWLSGTLFWPAWLRLAGMRVGRAAEVSTILDVLPEHTALGDWSFLADGIYLGVPRMQAGTVTVAATSLGNNTFLGNHVVIPAGQRLPGDLLLGVSTIADSTCMTAGSAWFGQPPFALPRREVATAERSLTHEPGALRRSNRLFWESLRFLLPALPVALVLMWFDVVGHAANTSSLWLALVLVPAATAGVGAVLALAILALKWLLLGAVRPGLHGLWSCWASRWDFHYVVWNRYGRALLTQLEGTLWLPWYLRAMGMRIGRRVVLGDGFAQVVDPDMIRLDDGATVHAMFQAHSFEDRVLKIDRVHIGAGATVGRGTVVLYGADIGDGAHVAAHSVVMKHEHLLPHKHYAGAPTAEVEPPMTVAAPAFAMAPEHAAKRRERDPALDVARGLAVLGMVLVHFVPDAGFAPLALLHGKPAALFVLLAGMAWAMQAHRRPQLTTLWRYTARRATALAIAGWLFWHFVWPTEVLLPFALMLPLAIGLVRVGTGALLLATAVLLVGAPLAAGLFAPFVAIDCLEDGTHLANASFGWHTLRYFAFDGSYPLLPWLALPLLGALLVARDERGAQPDGRHHARRWFWLALPLAVAMELWNALAPALEDELGDLAPFLTASWQPTSLPFFGAIAAWAIAVTAGLQWWQRARGLPAAVRTVGLIGRASLTHYLLHIVLVYAPLRLWWPAEDWSLGVGIAAALGYLAVAMPLTWLWFRRFRQGPFEALWARASG